MAAAAAISVLLHLAAFSFRLSSGGGLSSPLPVAVPLAVRIIPLAPPQSTRAEPLRAPEEATRASPRPESPPMAVRSETPVSTPPAPAAQPAPTPESPAPRNFSANSPAPAGYAAAAGLNPPPRPLDDITPDFPEAAGTRGGSVVLRLFINEAGGVDHIEVVRSSPPGLFEAAALAAFGAARFSPGFLAGIAVKSQVMYEVEFARQARDSAASGRTY